MDTRDKLTARIISDAEAEAKRIIDRAEAEKEKTLSRAEDDAARQAALIKSEAEKRAATVRENAASTADRTVRNACLARKREEVENVVNETLKRLAALPPDEYFELLRHTAESVATGEKGAMLLDPSDLRRMPDGFPRAVSAFNLTVDPSGTEIKGGGFILKYGKIEINESFSALAGERRERLEDGICPVLFG